MAENYKHLYEQTKKMLTMYQDELIPGFRKHIEELEAKSKWIPVSERLPDWRDGKVLVSTKYGFSICERTVNGRWKGQHANWITHWMPLPEPPREE